MIRPGILLLLGALAGTPQTTSSTRGRCSPAISQAGGNVTITYQSGSCPELDATTVAALKAFIAKFPKTVDRLNELLDKKDVELASRAKEVQDWVSKYTELEKQLSDRADDSELSRRAAERLRDNDLDAAGKLLDEIISRGESRLDRLAQDHFNRGRVYELQFRIDRAIVHYASAARYRPENTEYASAYALALTHQNQHGAATAAYESLLAIYRNRAEKDPAAYLPHVARTAIDLGGLYQDAQRQRDAEKLFDDALSTYRRLARDNPAHLGGVARALASLGDVYAATNRLAGAEKVYREALSAMQKLALEKPATHLGDLGLILNKLGKLYRATQRLADAEKAYREALPTYHKLARDNPLAYSGFLAMTLHNLGNVYSDTGRLSDAGQAYKQALFISRKLAEYNPVAYLPRVAYTLDALGWVYSRTDQLADAENTYRESLTIHREAADTNPAELPYLAVALTNLGVLYVATQRLTEAEKAFAEALSIRRELARKNQHAFTQDVVTTLLRLAVVRLGQGAKQPACAVYAEYRTLTTADPPGWASALKSACE
jgi:tetratricopeptide (TPR) repeat protein